MLTLHFSNCQPVPFGPAFCAGEKGNFVAVSVFRTCRTFLSSYDTSAIELFTLRVDARLVAIVERLR
jgi:hypothetical protein